MPSAYRLSPHVRPSRYELALELDPQRTRRYRGRVRITLELGQKRDVIELHAAELTLRRARIEHAGGPAKAQIELVAEDEIVRIVPASPLPKGSAVLELEFSGRLRDDLRGLYFARAGEQRYAFTQLEAADARRFFPCFDEPAYKARFALEVTTPARHTVLSNAPLATSERLPGGKKRVRFEETPLLSSYLFALAVGDLRGSRVEYAGKTPIRIWHVPGQERYTAFAREAARECLLRLERYFGVRYPYAKLDLVAVPDFEMGAMENAGAVFFRETLLLVDEQRASLPEKKRAAEVICHELAHMWYGDLVTMAWWDDLWLNEAFATWMAFDIVDQWQPELAMWNDFAHGRNSALGLDALKNTHPIYTRVRTPAEATESFDLITYEKGAAVIRMLERYLGRACFRRGVRDYIRKHALGNAKAEDLWAALTRHAGEGVGDVIRPWIERPGFPLVRMRTERRGKKRTLVLEQERFSAHGPERGGGKRDEAWPVPAVLKLVAGKRVRTVRLLFSGARARVPLAPGVRCVYGNADEGGFYRPLHEPALMRALAAELGRLNPIERLGFVNHSWAAVRAGYAELQDFLELCTAFGDEPDPDVLAALQGPLWHVLDRVAPALDASAAAQLREFIAATFTPAWQRAGFRPRRGESDRERLRRAELLNLVAVLAEDPEAVAAAEQQLTKYLDAPSTLDPNLAAPVVMVGARGADRARHREYLERSIASSTPQERKRFRLALAEVRDRALIDRTLRLCLGPKVPTQDVAPVLARLLESPFAREATWQFIRDRFAQLERRMSAMLASRLIEATPALQGERRRREVNVFFTRHPLPSATRALKQADERFVLDAALKKRAAPSLAAWLERRAALVREI